MDPLYYCENLTLTLTLAESNNLKEVQQLCLVICWKPGSINFKVVGPGVHSPEGPITMGHRRH